MRLAICFLLTASAIAGEREQVFEYLLENKWGEGEVVMHITPQLPTSALDNLIFVGVLAGKLHLEISSVDFHHEEKETVVSFSSKDPEIPEKISKEIRKWLHIKLREISKPNRTYRREPPRACFFI